MTSRRTLLSSLVGSLLFSPELLHAKTRPKSQAWAQLEKSSGGRLGVAWLDTGSGQLLGHRQDERFGLCSTFKLLLAAAALQQVDAGRFRLDQWVPFGPADRVPHAPVAEAHMAAGGMTLVALAEAIQTTSDNVAANVLMRLLGGDQGPQWLTQWLRERGDTVTRLDRWEPEMNRVPPGEVRDTSSPAAMALSTAKILTGDVLSPARRQQLTQWTIDTETGLKRLRAGLPKGWRAGDKTGSGWHPSMADKLNDVAIVWPPGRAPWVIAAFYETPAPRAEPMQAKDLAVLAKVARIAARS
jgi:beta-lactamase class A